MRFSPRAAAAAGAVAVAIGAGVGAAIASFGHVKYEAQASVRVSAKGPVAPLMPTMRELATSSVLAGDVRSTLRLRESTESLRRRIRAATPNGAQLVTVSYTNGNRTRAGQITQEIAVKLTELIPARFSTIPGLKASLFDQAHVVARSAPDFLGDALIGGAIGLVIGLAGVAAMLRRVPALMPARNDGALAEREARLKERIAAVTSREQALARRAGELAKRERALEASEPEPPPVTTPPTVTPPPVPTPVAEPPPAAAPFATATSPSRRTLNDLERLVRKNADRFPDAVDEWNTYLFFLRDYADPSGRLPPSFDSLIDDVFGRLEA